MFLTDRHVVFLCVFNLCPGDIILEIEGHRIRKIELAASILREKYGTITMAMVTIDNVLHLPYPVRDSSPSSMVPVGMTRPRGSRVRKARDLFAKVRIKRRSLFLVEAYI